MTGFGSSCGACKFLRRKCTNQCVFAPYFCYEQAATHFSAVHKVFGASNVSKLLLHLPVHNRSDAATTISYEALARMRDPVYGCVAHIFSLQQQVAYLQEEIEILGTQMANFTPAGVANCGSHGVANNNNPYAGPQLYSQLDAINAQNSQNQQGLIVSHAGDEAANYQAFDEQLMNIQVPLSGWEAEQKLLCDQSVPDDLERIFEETDLKNLGNYPCLIDDSDSMLRNCTSPSWGYGYD
ncbi:hypothetical protein FNV43_RR24770 [Rhamnella rubrinervis]|uniref:LOB domain-containing protein n=1 Tax=Rhamnella rubrinervis TaxID=2594499 RepID=A0A8K0DM57_9ROSA|nr:hypothetical protein FNV43_RR24770 [Rhamnella rubrinervis]